MKRLGILLLLLSNSVLASWKSVGDDATATTYVDPATMSANGATVQMTSVRDYKAFQRMVEVGYFSQKMRAEYECAERKARDLSLSLHADHMGEGKVIYEDTSPHEWEPIPPDTLTEVLWKIACQPKP